MKLLRFSLFSFAFVALLSISTFAQTAEKIAVIDTRAFALQKGGITKYVTQQTKLNNEFKPVNQQLNTLATRINNLKKEINTLRNSKAPVDPKTITSKAEEHDKLVRELKFKRENAQADIDRRSQALLGPISSDIYKAMQAYAKQKGYTMILDAAKLEGAGLVLAFDRKYDVTADFIKFYNERPAGTATK